MSYTKRKNKRRKNHVILKLSLIVMLVSICLGAVFLFFKLSGKSGFISPLSSSYNLNSNSGIDQDSVQIEKLLKSKNIKYKSVKVGNRVTEIVISEDSRVLLSTGKDNLTQIASLQFILARLTMEGRAFKELDLRFDKPIIRK